MALSVGSACTVMGGGAPPLSPTLIHHSKILISLSIFVKSIIRTHGLLSGVEFDSILKIHIHRFSSVSLKDFFRMEATILNIFRRSKAQNSVENSVAVIGVKMALLIGKNFKVKKAKWNEE